MSQNVFGLRIRSAPGLGLDSFESTAAPDVKVQLESPTELDPGPPLRIHFDGVALELAWHGVGRARASSELLSVRPVPGATGQHLLAMVQSSLPLVPFLRGATLLHGSCVRLGASAISVVGPSGTGKSTVAAALLDRGHRLVSDGVTVVTRVEEDPEVLPGLPVQRLWPDALTHLGDNPTGHPNIYPGHPKRIRPSEVARSPVRLGRIYLVEDGENETVLPLAAAAAAAEVARSMYLGTYLPPELLPRILARAAHLTNRIPTVRLSRRLELQHLAALLDVIEADSQ